MAKYKIAGVVFEFNAKTKGAHKMLDEYKYLGDKPACFSFSAPSCTSASARASRAILVSPQEFFTHFSATKTCCVT